MGKIVDTIQLDSKPFIVFGRLPTCDVPMEHPSLSRFHAILQYRWVLGLSRYCFDDLSIGSMLNILLFIIGLQMNLPKRPRIKRKGFISWIWAGIYLKRKTLAASVMHLSLLRVQDLYVCISVYEYIPFMQHSRNIFEQESSGSQHLHSAENGSHVQVRRI